MRYRVTENRVMTGYELKASFLYEAGQIVDDTVDPPGHVERLLAAGVLEPIAEDPPPPVPARRGRAAS